MMQQERIIWRALILAQKRQEISVLGCIHLNWQIHFKGPFGRLEMIFIVSHLDSDTSEEKAAKNVINNIEKLRDSTSTSFLASPIESDSYMHYRVSDVLDTL